MKSTSERGAWDPGEECVPCTSTLWIAFVLLTVVAFFAILFTGRYPRSIFDFVMGMNRWACRVAAYAALMTDAYPPFRLDTGGREAAPDGAEPDVVRHTPAAGLS